GTVGIIRRRRLVAGRGLGQRIPGRLGLEWGRLGLVAAEQAAEATAIAELRRAQDRIVVRGTGLHRIVVLARGRRGLAHGELGRRQDAGRFARVLVLFLARRDGSLAALLVGILWPVRRLHF